MRSQEIPIFIKQQAASSKPSTAAVEEQMNRMMDSIVAITQELQVLKGDVLYSHYEAARICDLGTQ